MNNRLHSSFPESIHNKIPITKNNYQDLIIDAPISNFKTKRDSFRFVIDSRDRDYQKYPNPNNYVINITNEITNVTSIELVKGYVPNSQYVINNTNNTLHYNFLDECCINKITIENGNYTIEDLEEELNNKFKDILHFEYIEIKKKYKIINCSKKDITLIFRDFRCYKCQDSGKCKKCFYSPDIKYLKTSIGQVIGFNPTNIEILKKKDILPPNIINLNTNNYIILSISELSKIHSNRDCLHGAYSIIPFDCYYDKQINASTSSNMNDVKHFNPPIPRFRKLTIKFLNRDGSEYDFNGVDHILDFRVYALNYKNVHI
jgi:hypothetical protein